MNQPTEVLSLSPRAKKAWKYTGITLLVLVVAWVVYAVAVTPSKQPYQTALAAYKKVYNANLVLIEAGGALGSSNANDKQFSANVEAARTALTKLDNEVAVLGKQKVLKQGEGKRLYADFHSKFQKYAAYNTAVLDTIEAVRPVLYGCNTASENLSELAVSSQVLETCASELKAIQNVPDADYAQMVAEFASAYHSLGQNVAAATALKDTDGVNKEKSEAYASERTRIVDDMNATSSALSKNLQTSRSKVDITKTAKALDDYLRKKSSILPL